MTESWRLIVRELLARRLVKRAGVDRVVRKAAARGEGVETALVRESLISKGRLLALKSQIFGLEAVDLTEVEPDPDAATLVPEQMARRNRAVALWHDDRRLMLAVQEPLDAIACAYLEMRCSLEVVQMVAFEGDFEAAWRSAYSRAASPRRAPAPRPITPDAVPVKKIARLPVDPIHLDLPTEVAPAKRRPNVSLPSEWRPSRAPQQQITAQYPGETYYWRPSSNS